MLKGKHVGSDLLKCAERLRLTNWLKRGVRERPGVYRDLYLAVEKTEAYVELFHLKNIETASAKSWFATAWFLERKHPERWGKREATPADDRERDEAVIIGERGVALLFQFFLL